ncbi:hypothetical protein FGO68_gene1601 [Halteria grandinella]|uniref:Uncharacterized protein n=1 Tax=Halteria grandinella TaxID=5974 RepID=A0A8J8T158_HALGN|nr:hypothetical protein FGO68_gene1601 [Halteria grandinella]
MSAFELKASSSDFSYPFSYYFGIQACQGVSSLSSTSLSYCQGFHFQQSMLLVQKYMDKSDCFQESQVSRVSIAALRPSSQGKSEQ